MMYNLDLTIFNLYYKFYIHDSHSFELYFTDYINIKHIIKTWIDKGTIKFDLHSLFNVYKLASNLIGSRTHINNLSLILETITYVSNTE